MVGPSTDPAIVAVLVVDAVLDRGAVLARLEACRFLLDDLVSFVILWGGLNLYARNWVPPRWPPGPATRCGGSTGSTSPTGEAAGWRIR